MFDSNRIRKKNATDSGRYNTGYPGTNYNQYQGINQNRNSVKFDDIYIPYYHQNA